MEITVIVYFFAVSFFGIAECIDPSVHVSFARVSPKKLSARSKRDVVQLSLSAYTEDEKKEMLDAHNEYRRTTEPSAADMNLLTWNTQLADSAQTWAEQCIWDHGQVEFENQQYDPMGQNLWRGNNKVSVSAVNAWHNEDRYYTFFNDTCQSGKACGHYTQVVWADTKEVGCGFKSCDDGTTIVACNYGPAGNYNHQPFTEGPRCSECNSPGFCYDGQLCSSHCHDPSVVSGNCECSTECQNCGVLNETECACSCKQGWNGDQCTEPCEDTHNYCNNGWYPAQCGRYSYVNNGCPLMCGDCKPMTDENQCPCNGKMCRNGGELDINSCGCQCTDGYTGDVCESVVSVTQTPSTPTAGPVCDGKTCQNNGVLITSTCTCECAEGYTGDLCENVVIVTTAVQVVTEKTTTVASKPATTTGAIHTTKTTERKTTTMDIKQVTTTAAIKTAKTTEKIDDNTGMPPCDHTCPAGYIMDQSICQCIKDIYGDSVGSANTLKSSTIYVVTMVILVCNSLGTW